MTSERLPDAFGMAVGTYEDALAMVGRRTEPVPAEFAVNEAMIKRFCALVEDPTACYWDEDFAREHWGGFPAPPAMLMIWLMPLGWSPGASDPRTLLPAQVPLPGDSLINVANDVEILAPVLVGDRLSVTEELVSVSPEKATALGAGHFVTTRSSYANQRGEVVGVVTNTLLRFGVGA